MSKNNTRAARWQELLEQIETFLAKNRDKHYIFRGQDSYTATIRSTLHRKLGYSNRKVEPLEKPNSSPSTVSLPNPLLKEQQKLLQDTADRFFPGENEVEILAQLQHLGAPTNFIDFSDDYLVALFFACSGSAQQDKRKNSAIYFYRVDKGELRSKIENRLIEKMSSQDFIFRSHSRNNRILTQRSCFVHRRTGILEKPSHNIPQGLNTGEKICCLRIKREWFEAILSYLEERGISFPYLFNDLEGYVRYLSVYENITVWKEQFFAALKQKKSERAEKALEKIIEHNQVEAASYASRFVQEFREKNQWIETFNNFFKEEERAADFYLHRGILYQLQSGFFKLKNKYEEAEKKWERAEEDFNKAIELKPNSCDVYTNRGALYVRQGGVYRIQNKFKEAQKKWKLAEADFDKALELKPDSYDVYINRGIFYAKQGDFYDAQNKFKEAEEKWYLAEADFNKALELNPARHEAQLGLNFLRRLQIEAKLLSEATDR